MTSICLPGVEARQKKSWLVAQPPPSSSADVSSVDLLSSQANHDSSSGYLRTSWPLMAPEAAYLTSIMSPTSADTGSSCSRRSHGAAALQ